MRERGKRVAFAVATTGLLVAVGAVYVFVRTPLAILALGRVLETGENQKERERAAIRLAALGPSGVARLCAALGSDLEQVCAAAVIGMEHLGPHAANAGPVLIQALSDERYKVSYQCTKGLIRIGEAVVPRLVEVSSDAPDELREKFADVFGRIGVASEPVCNLLIAWLSNVRPVRRNADCRAAAANAIGLLAGKGQMCDSAIPMLIRSLYDPDRSVRERAAYAIGRFRSSATSAVTALMGLLQDQGEDVRAAACRSLGQIGQQAELVAPELCRILRTDRVEFVRMMAAEALGGLGATAGSMAIPALIDALRDKSGGVRAQSCEALGEFGKAAQGAVEELRRVSRQHELLRKPAEEAIERIEMDVRKSQQLKQTQQ